MKKSLTMLAVLGLAAMAASGGDVNVVLDSTGGASAFRVLDQASNAVLDVQSGTILRLGRFQPPALDQRQWEYSDYHYIPTPTGNVWQSFTVGIDGRLSRIVWWHNFYGSYVATGLIQVREGEGNAGAILWSKVVTWDGYSPPFDVDSNIVVSAGDVLTIEILSIGELLIPGYAEGNPYAGGQSSENPDWDFMFETYITPVDANTALISVPAGNFGIGVEPTPSSERLTVAGNIVATGSVTAALFAGNGAGLTNIGSVSLADGAVTAGKLATGAVGSAALASNAVDSARIAAGAVQNSDLATFAVTSNKILWGEVHTEALADGAVTADKIANGAVGYAALADHSVTSVKIASNAVGPAELNDNAVESRALASASVGTLALHDNAVTTAKLTNSVVTSAKLADGACLAELANNDGTGSGLDADLLDGLDSGVFSPRLQAGGLVPAGTTTNILPPHFVPFTLQLAAENPFFGGVAYVFGFENDSHVSITYNVYNGADGTSTNGGAKGTYGTATDLLQFGSTNYRYYLRCQTGLAGLELSTTNSTVGAYYRLIY
jgi:hypothetical protein